MSDDFPIQLRGNLERNSSGRLSFDQWFDLVMEPVLPLSLLALPPVILLLLPAGRLFARELALFRAVLPLLPLLILGALLMRAWRYGARTLYTDELHAGEAEGRKLPEFYSASGQPVVFRRALIPMPTFTYGERYRLYYIEDGGGRVLLSAVRATHPDIYDWSPSALFYQQATRGRRKRTTH